MPNLEFKRTSKLSTIIGENLKPEITYQGCREGDQHAHFIFPVLGARTSEKIHGHYFIPLFKPPGGFYVTRKKGVNISNLITQCVQLWPLLLMCIVMATIAGKS